MAEKDKEKTLPKEPGDSGPTEDGADSPPAGASDSEKGNLESDAKEILDDVEKARRRARQKAAEIEADDSQPLRRHKQAGGE